MKFERNALTCFFKTPEVMQHILKGLLPLDYIETPGFTLSIFDKPSTGDWVIVSENEEIIEAIRTAIKSYEIH